MSTQGNVNRSMWNKSVKYYVCIFCAMALGYGFTLTHFSIGVDDELFRSYFYEGGLLMQERWFQPALAQVVHIFEFLPFWRDFLSLCISVVALHFLFNELNDCAQNRFDENAEIIFICIVEICTFHAYRFIFAMTTISTAFMMLCQALIVRAIKIYTRKRSIKNGLFLILSVFVSRIVSETAIIWGVTSGGFALTLYLIYNDQKVQFRRIFADVMLFVGAILLSMIVYNGLTDAIFYILGRQSSGYTENMSNVTLENLLNMCRMFPEKLFSMAKEHTTIAIYFLLTIALLITGVVKAIKQRNVTVIVAIIICAVSPFFMYFITCNWHLALRIFSGISLYLGIAAIVLYAEFKEIRIQWKEHVLHLQNIMLALVVVIVVNQSCEMNRIFYNDYLTYQRDQHKMEAIYQDILKVSGGVLDKPVCFVGVPKSYGLKDSGQGETYSIFEWDRMQINDLINHRIISFFNMHGLPIEQLTVYDENIIHAQAAKMSMWPKEGSVQDFGEYVIVNLYAHYDCMLTTKSWNALCDKQNDKIMVSACVDSIETTDNEFSVAGWAIMHGVPSYDTVTKLYLVGTQNTYVFNPYTNRRADVTNEIAAGINYDESGFAMKVYLTMLESGEYSLFLGIDSGEYAKIIDLNHIITVK